MKEADTFQDTISAEEFFIELTAHQPAPKPPPPPRPPVDQDAKKHIPKSGKQTR